MGDGGWGGGVADLSKPIAPLPALRSIGVDTWQKLRRFHVWENTDMQLPVAVWVAP